VSRTERYMSSKTVFGNDRRHFVLMCVLYIYMSGLIGGAIAAALVMLIVGFFFATVSGYLVGVIGSSNNPISGLTLSTLVIAALLMVTLGVSGTGGVVAVLAWRRWSASPPPWPANCCRISRSDTFSAARRAPFRSSN
jgi:uncharacterized oligopeptide transporter (OPT) family protein